VLHLFPPTDSIKNNQGHSKRLACMQSSEMTCTRTTPAGGAQTGVLGGGRHKVAATASKQGLVKNGGRVRQSRVKPRSAGRFERRGMVRVSAPCKDRAVGCLRKSNVAGKLVKWSSVDARKPEMQGVMQSKGIAGHKRGFTAHATALGTQRQPLPAIAAVGATPHTLPCGSAPSFRPPGTESVGTRPPFWVQCEGKPVGPGGRIAPQAPGSLAP
jgi:hypothetical protein